jgi:hypothetical protein
MPAIPSASLARLCGPVFGLSLERDRLDILIRELEPILAEIAKLREIELGDLDPAVIFDAETSYRGQTP